MFLVRCLPFIVLIFSNFNGDYRPSISQLLKVLWMLMTLGYVLF